MAFIWGKHIFCDTVLSMGLKSSAAICQRVTTAISFIMFQIGIAILNYMDDLAGAEKKNMLILHTYVLEQCYRRVVLRRLQIKHVVQQKS